jgi:Zn-dependent peptidase ImmA (M78 family)
MTEKRIKSCFNCMHRVVCKYFDNYVHLPINTNDKKYGQRFTNFHECLAELCCYHKWDKEI